MVAFFQVLIAAYARSPRYAGLRRSSPVTKQSRVWMLDVFWSDKEDNGT